MTPDATQLVRDQPQNARTVPARIIPVPQTVSEELQKSIALPLPDVYQMEPKTRDEWKNIIDALTAKYGEPLPNLREVLRVRAVPQTVAGIHVFVITPEEIATTNRNRLLVHLHAGAYIALEG